MKIYNKIILSALLSSNLFALPEEGQLIMPNDNNQIENQLPNQNVNSLSKNNLKSNKNNTSEDIIQVLDEANKKRLEFEEMKNAKKEKEKENDKDYVLEQIKKDNEIYDEKIKRKVSDEKMKQKEKDLKLLDRDKSEQYQDSLKTKIATLESLKNDFSNTIKVDGNFSLKIFGDSKKIIIPTLGLNNAIENLMIQKKDNDEVKNQIVFYKEALKSKNEDYLKELKTYEPLYKKSEFVSLKSNFIDSSRSEFSEGDLVYKDIYITNITKYSYTLIIK